MMHRLAIIFLAASCTTRGTVSVVANDPGPGFTLAPLAGLTVVFADRDGSSRTATLDASGQASGQIESGGSVWLVHDTRTTGGGFLATAYDEIEPGDTITFGPPPVDARTPVATLGITGQPPAGAVVVYASSCGKAMGDDAIAFDSRCTGPADVLAVAYDAPTASMFPLGQMRGYAYVTGVTVTAGTLAIPATAWRTPDAVSVQLANLGDAAFGNQQSIANDFGTRAQILPPDADHPTSYTGIPLVGGHLRLRAEITRDGFFKRQMISVELPLAATATIDATHVLGPWIAVRSAQDTGWSEDDEGGALSAQAMVTEYEWQTFVGAQLGNQVWVISPPGAPGSIAALALPDALASHQPELVHSNEIYLLRFDTGTYRDVLPWLDFFSQPNHVFDDDGLYGPGQAPFTGAVAASE